jgi:hypothetical protein
MGDVIIDGLTGANRLVILDANVKIPAVDGSNVTAIAGANFSTGTIPVARLDTGTTAGKIVKLDGNAKLPAVSGVAITGIVGATKNASDPTISTNPSGGVGTEWQNTTSGAVFVCTNATAGANVWTNVGGRSGDVVPYVYQGSSYGYSMGGYHYSDGVAPYRRGAHPNIDKWSYASDGNATDVGDLENKDPLSYSQALWGSTKGSSASNMTHGYTLGGANDAAGSPTSPAYASHACEKVAFATDSGGADVGDLILAANATCGHSDGNYGYVCGGATETTLLHFDMIQSKNFASEANADTTQNLSAARNRMVACQTLTYGYLLGGAYTTTATATDIIERYQFATTNHCVDVGDLVMGARRESGGSSSLTHGYTHAGTRAVAATKINVIEKVQMVATANSTDVADTMVTKTGMTGTSSTTHGYTVGHLTSSAGAVDITKYSHSSDVNATDVGDLTKPTSNSHTAQF